MIRIGSFDIVQLQITLWKEKQKWTSLSTMNRNIFVLFCVKFYRNFHSLTMYYASFSTKNKHHFVRKLAQNFVLIGQASVYRVPFIYFFFISLKTDANRIEPDFISVVFCIEWKSYSCKCTIINVIFSALNCNIYPLFYRHFFPFAMEKKNTNLFWKWSTFYAKCLERYFTREIHFAHSSSEFIQCFCW